MKVAVTGIGAWGPGFSSTDELRAILETEASPEITNTARPAPVSIPPRERRRAPLSVKLAVAVAEQACAAAGVAPSDPVSVFASGMGDMDITDYMCRTLASDMPLISPTRFHNSVHNAPVGYWSISQGARRSSNAVAGFQHTVPASLLEAVTQCVTEGETVLWACQDIASPGPFRDIANISEACAFALIFEPSAPQGAGLTIDVTAGSGVWPALEPGHLPRHLMSLYGQNPTARVLPLVAALVAAPCSVGSDRITLPLNDHLDLAIMRS